MADQNAPRQQASLACPLEDRGQPFMRSLAFMCAAAISAEITLSIQPHRALVDRATARVAQGPWVNTTRAGSGLNRVVKLPRLSQLSEVKQLCAAQQVI